jgi:hypothetical protein
VETIIIKRPQELPELHANVLAALPVGRENAITISYLMDKLAISQSDRRRVSNTISELIFKYGYPIGTSSDELTKGIFLIENEADLTLACRTLNSRAMANLKRHKKIIENFNNINQLQADI